MTIYSCIGLLLLTVIAIGYTIFAICTVFLHIYKVIQSDNMYKISFGHKFKKFKAPLIKLKIKDKFYYFLVDSGAELNVITQNYSDILPTDSYTLKPTSVKVSSIHSTQIINQALSLNLSFGYEHYNDTLFTIANISQYTKIVKNNIGIDVIGILGTPFFEKYKWSIDFDKRCIWVKANHKKKNKINYEISSDSKSTVE